MQQAQHTSEMFCDHLFLCLLYYFTQDTQKTHISVSARAETESRYGFDFQFRLITNRKWAQLVFCAFVAGVLWLECDCGWGVIPEGGGGKTVLFQPILGAC